MDLSSLIKIKKIKVLKRMVRILLGGVGSRGVLSRAMSGAKMGTKSGKGKVGCRTLFSDIQGTKIPWCQHPFLQFARVKNKMSIIFLSFITTFWLHITARPYCLTPTGSFLLRWLPLGGLLDSSFTPTAVPLGFPWASPGLPGTLVNFHFEFVLTVLFWKSFPFHERF